MSTDVKKCYSKKIRTICLMKNKHFWFTKLLAFIKNKESESLLHVIIISEYAQNVIKSYKKSETYNILHDIVSDEMLAGTGHIFLESGLI